MSNPNALAQGEPIAVPANICPQPVSCTADCLCDESLVLWLPFQGTSIDASGKSNAVSREGAPLFVEDRFGEANAAMGFDQLDDRVLVAQSAALGIDNFQNGYTLAAWIKPSRLPHDQRDATEVILSSAAESLSLFLEQDGALEASHRTFESQTAQAAGCNVPEGSWSHVAVTWSGSVPTLNWQIFLNGLPCLGYTGTVGPPFAAAAFSNLPENLAIGANDYIVDYPPAYFAGAIDSVRVYNRALSAVEMRRLAAMSD